MRGMIVHVFANAIAMCVCLCVCATGNTRANRRNTLHDGDNRFSVAVALHVASRGVRRLHAIGSWNGSYYVYTTQCTPRRA